MLSVISRIVSAWFAFLLPCYATFKALARRPLSEPDLTKIAMYWSVIGVFVAFEYTAEWLVSWMPFYWELKLLVLLFLSLPQTQGSTYIYLAYLQPFFTRNEADLDAGIVAIQRNVLSFIQAKLSGLLDLIWALAGKQGHQAQSAQSGPQAPSSLSWLLSSDVVRGAVQMLQSSTAPQSSVSTPSNSRQNSGISTASTSARPSPASYDNNAGPPPFPVPQHFHES